MLHENCLMKKKLDHKNIAHNSLELHHSKETY